MKKSELIGLGLVGWLIVSIIPLSPEEFNSALLNSKKTHTRVAMGCLKDACDAFFEEYQALPLATVSTDSERITTGKRHNIMPPLCFLDSGSESPKHQTFFEYHLADEKKDGLTRTSGYPELFDPWGHPYHVLFDYDYSETLKDPFTGEIIKNIKVLVWSLGPDGKSGTPETNEDNVYSWK